MQATAEQRFWSKVKKTEACWLWMATRNNRGYGQLWVNGRHVYAHRYAYELLVGSIPAGLQIDHVKNRGCTNRNCVRPEHLEPVTPHENTLRGNSGANKRAVTHCPYGHPYDSENTRVYRGWRLCRTCAQVRRKAWLLKKES